MIVACPECTSPFEVVDGQIAPLVQVECPTCSFRMILDFAAANDASLREQGMQMAQGFRDEAAYRAAVGAGYAPPAEATAAPERPSLRAVPEPEPEPEPEIEAPTPVAEPVRRPPVAPPIERPPVRQPVAQPPVEPEPQPELDKPPVRHSRSRPTLIAHTPPPPQQQLPTPPEHIGPEPIEAPELEAEVETHVGPPPTQTPAWQQDEIAVDLDFDQPFGGEEYQEPDVAEPVETPVYTQAPEVQVEQPVRTPPHTPVREPELEAPRPEPSTTTTKPTSKPEAAAEAGKGDKTGDKQANAGKQESTASKVIKLIVLVLLLAAAGLMTWSLLETQNPNPIPMLQEKFLGGGAAPEAGAEADAKSAGDAAK